MGLMLRLELFALDARDAGLISPERHPRGAANDDGDGAICSEE